MAEQLFQTLALAVGAPPPRKYWDKTNYKSFDEQQDALAVSTTCYVGNLSYHTPEDYIYELARQAGPIRRVIMGLNKLDKTPCGFAFVEYFSRADCIAAQFMLTGKMLEGRAVKFELDPGFLDGRQYGRGSGGGQIRDDLRSEFDSDRGGFGTGVADETKRVRVMSNYPPPPQPASNALPSSLEATMTLDSSIRQHQRLGSHAHHQAPSRREHHHYQPPPPAPMMSMRGSSNRRDRSRSPTATRNRYPPSQSYHAPPPPPLPQSSQQQQRGQRARKVDEFGRDLVNDDEDQDL